MIILNLPSASAAVASTNDVNLSNRIDGVSSSYSSLAIDLQTTNAALADRLTLLDQDLSSQYRAVNVSIEEGMRALFQADVGLFEAVDTMRTTTTSYVAALNSSFSLEMNGLQSSISEMNASSSSALEHLQLETSRINTEVRGINESLSDLATRTGDMNVTVNTRLASLAATNSALTVETASLAQKIDQVGTAAEKSSSEGLGKLGERLDLSIGEARKVARDEDARLDESIKSSAIALSATIASEAEKSSTAVNVLRLHVEEKLASVFDQMGKPRTSSMLIQTSCYSLLI